MKATFPRNARVRARAEYTRVFDSARRTSDPLMSLHWLPAAHPPRLGLAVSRKVSTRAVIRNRIKRGLREQFRQIRNQLPAGDYVVVARSAAAVTEPAQLRSCFLRVLARAGALPVAAADGTMPADRIPPSPLSKPGSTTG